MSDLKTYRGTITQTIFSTININAAHWGEARNKAADRYGRDKGRLLLNPVQDWDHDFGHYGIEEIFPVRAEATRGAL